MNGIFSAHTNKPELFLLNQLSFKAKKFSSVLKQNNVSPKQLLGMSVGNQATLAKADACRELIRASSETPPDKDRGPTGSTLHNISSL